MNQCPYCGCETFYTKERVCGQITVRHNFGGSEADNSEMYEGIAYKYASKFIFCNECNKKIGKLSDVGL